MKKIAFICVNYNNVNYTIDFIKSLNNICKTEFIQIVVVDNASKDNSVEVLHKLEMEYTNVMVIYSKTNVGYFKGLNLGINKLKTEDYDYIVIGNNDLTFDRSFTEKLTLKTFNEDVLVVSPNIIRMDGIHQNPHIVKKFGTFEKLYRRVYFSNYYISIVLQMVYNLLRSNIKPVDREGFDVEQDIIMGYGACYILTRNFFRNFNSLDAPNFLMGEEGVLANQVLSVQGRTLFDPSLIVNHHDHSSIGKVSSRKLYDFSRESYFYYLKNLKNLH